MPARGRSPLSARLHQLPHRRGEITAATRDVKRLEDTHGETPRRSLAHFTLYRETIDSIVARHPPRGKGDLKLFFGEILVTISREFSRRKEEATAKQVGRAPITVAPTGHYPFPARGRSPLSARLKRVVTGRGEITAATRVVKRA